MLDMNYRITTKRNGITIVDTDQTLPNANYLPLDSISVEASMLNLTDFATHGNLIKHLATKKPD